MNENERRQENIQQQKAKIRRRYQGMEPEKIRVIPVTVSQPDFYDDSEPRRVAVYARVSTGDPRQTSSYELQRNYYEKQVQKHPNWTLVSIYADEGRSGTSTKKRKEFNRMIEDCKAGKIDIKPRYLIQCQLQHKQKKCEKRRFRSIYSIQNRHFSFGKNYPVGERNRSKLCLNPLPAI